MRNRIIILVLFAISLSLFSCGDPLPTEYKPETIVQALIYVDQPIKGIQVVKTEAIGTAYKTSKALLTDEMVKISGDGREFNLKADTSNGLYFYCTDSTYLVKPETVYSIEINLADGTKITGSTTTPPRTMWLRKPSKEMQFPKDTVNFPDRDSISWEGVNNFNFYMLTVRCLDTLNYGKYLTPQTAELNRRMAWREMGDHYFDEITSIALIQNNQSSIVWGVFKWYGLQETSIYVPDYNYLKWFIQYATKNNYDSNLGTLKGGKGFFGSASVIRDTSVLLKNQP